MPDPVTSRSWVRLERTWLKLNLSSFSSMLPPGFLLWATWVRDHRL
jgi:hypothetical protein